MNIKYKYYYNCKYFYHEKILSNKKKSSIVVNFFEDYNRYGTENFNVH